MWYLLINFKIYDQFPDCTSAGVQRTPVSRSPILIHLKFTPFFRIFFILQNITFGIEKNGKRGKLRLGENGWIDLHHFLNRENGWTPHQSNNRKTRAIYQNNRNWVKKTLSNDFSLYSITHQYYYPESYVYNITFSSDSGLSSVVQLSKEALQAIEQAGNDCGIGKRGGPRLNYDDLDPKAWLEQKSRKHGQTSKADWFIWFGTLWYDGNLGLMRKHHKLRIAWFGSVRKRVNIKCFRSSFFDGAHKSMNLPNVQLLIRKNIFLKLEEICLSIYRKHVWNSIFNIRTSKLLKLNQ